MSDDICILDELLDRAACYYAWLRSHGKDTECTSSHRQGKSLDGSNMIASVVGDVCLRS